MYNAVCAPFWLLSLLFLAQDIPGQVKGSCRSRSIDISGNGSAQSTGAQYVDLKNPLLCSGALVAWRFCFYTENIQTNGTYRAYIRLYRKEGERLLFMHEVETKKALESNFNHTSSFLCCNITLKQDEYLPVAEGDILAAYIPMHSPLIIAGQETVGSLYMNTSNSTDQILTSNLVELNDSALHLYADIVPTSTNGESKVSRAAIGAVVATVVVLLIGTLCVIGTTTVLLCKRWRAKHLKKNVANHTDASYSIENATYDSSLMTVDRTSNNNTVNRIENPTIPSKVELRPTGKGLKECTNSTKRNKQEVYHAKELEEVFNIYATLKPATSEFRCNVKKMVATLTRKKITPYYMPAAVEEQIYEQISEQDVPAISVKTIRPVDHLGSGQFAAVEKAVWKTGHGTIEVAVKTLYSHASLQDRVKLLQEAAIMAQFHHPNVVFLCGIIFDNQNRQTSLVMEYVSKGDLRGCLLKLKPNPIDKNSDDAVLCQVLLSYSHQIALGMLYLSDKGFVHRDLAARNVLVSSRDICKIADFGMSRDLADAEYYISEGGTIPIKWTAPEAVYYRKYSTSSDVWSYGCLLYEIWSLGQKPFANLTNTEVLKYVSDGFRLPPPPGCPRSIYKIIIECWHPVHSERPSFQNVLISLLEDEEQALDIPASDAASHPLAAHLGAPPIAGEKMYTDLQMTYLPPSTRTIDTAHRIVRVERNAQPVSEYQVVDDVKSPKYDTVERGSSISGSESSSSKSGSFEAMYSTLSEVKDVISTASEFEDTYTYSNASQDGTENKKSAVHSSRTDAAEYDTLELRGKEAHQGGSRFDPFIPPQPPAPSLKQQNPESLHCESAHYEIAQSWSKRPTSDHENFEGSANVQINNDYLVV